MEIIGRGFLARHLAPFTTTHDEVTVLAAGVSRTGGGDETQAFQREADLVRATTSRCRAMGRTVVFFSTASHAIYAGAGTLADEHSALPRSPYGHHKLRLEETIAAETTNWLVLRLSHAVGTHQRAHQLFPALVSQVCAGEVQVYENTHRDLIDVDDIVACLKGLLDTGIRNQVVNVAAGTPYPVPDIVRGIEQRLDRQAHWTVVQPASTGGPATVDTGRLRQLVPDQAPAGGDAYLNHLLDRYTNHYARYPVAG
jgi:nucleoside-diphosphate-sugar epimerase